MVVTSYGRNKNREDEIRKNQEKAYSSSSYRCAAINNQQSQAKRSGRLDEGGLPFGGG